MTSRTLLPGATGSPSRGPSLREQTLLVCALIGTSQMTWGVVVPVLPVYIERFGMTAAVLGPLIAAFGLGRTIANIPAGVLLRRWHPRRYMIVVLLGLAAATAATSLVSDPVLLTAARLVAGLLGGAAVTIGFAVLIAGAPEGRRGSTMATATVVQMSSSAVGSLLGGVTVTVLGSSAAFVVAALPVLLCLGWEALRPPRHYWSALEHRPSDPPPAPGGAGRAGVVALLPTIAVLVGVSFATFFARFAGDQGLTPVLGYTVGGLTPLTLGIALAVSTGASLLALPVVGRIVDRGARLSVYLPAVGVVLLALTVFPWAANPWLFGAVLALYGLANSVAGVVPNVVTGERVPRRMTGTVVGITRSAGDAGAVLGPLLVFAAYDAGGGVAGVAVIAAVLLSASSCFAVSVARSRARARRPDPGEEDGPAELRSSG